MYEVQYKTSSYYNDIIYIRMVIFMKVLVLPKINEANKNKLLNSFQDIEFIFDSQDSVTQELINEADIVVGNPRKNVSLYNENLKALFLNSAGSDTLYYHERYQHLGRNSGIRRSLLSPRYAVVLQLPDRYPGRSGAFHHRPYRGRPEKAHGAGRGNGFFPGSGALSAVGAVFIKESPGAFRSGGVYQKIVICSRAAQRGPA
jgi:hypothetical protein